MKKNIFDKTFLPDLKLIEISTEGANVIKNKFKVEKYKNVKSIADNQETIQNTEENNFLPLITSSMSATTLKATKNLIGGFLLIKSALFNPTETKKDETSENNYVNIYFTRSTIKSDICYVNLIETQVEKLRLNIEKRKAENLIENNNEVIISAENNAIKLITEEKLKITKKTKISEEEYTHIQNIAKLAKVEGMLIPNNNIQPKTKASQVSKNDFKSNIQFDTKKQETDLFTYNLLFNKLNNFLIQKQQENLEQTQQTNIKSSLKLGNTKNFSKKVKNLIFNDSNKSNDLHESTATTNYKESKKSISSDSENESGIEIALSSSESLSDVELEHIRRITKMANAEFNQISSTAKKPLGIYFILENIKKNNL